jgi:hypothetical protein
MNGLLLTLMIAFASLHTYAAEAELTFRCKFSEGQSTTFDDGSPSSKRSEFPDLIFDKINVEKGTARIIGNNGAVDIVAMRGSESVHLVEQTATGNLSISTIFTNEKFKKINSYPIVISRHMSIAVSPHISQHRGLCKFLN